MTEEDFNYLPAGLAFLDSRKSWNQGTASVFSCRGLIRFRRGFFLRVFPQSILQLKVQGRTILPFLGCGIRPAPVNLRQGSRSPAARGRALRLPAFE